MNLNEILFCNKEGKFVVNKKCKMNPLQKTIAERLATSINTGIDAYASAGKLPEPLQEMMNDTITRLDHKEDVESDINKRIEALHGKAIRYKSEMEKGHEIPISEKLAFVLEALSLR